MHARTRAHKTCTRAHTHTHTQIHLWDSVFHDGPYGRAGNNCHYRHRVNLIIMQNTQNEAVLFNVNVLERNVCMEDLVNKLVTSTEQPEKSCNLK